MNRKAAVLEILEAGDATAPDMAERVFGEITRRTRNRVHGVLRELEDAGQVERAGTVPRQRDPIGGSAARLRGRPATLWRIVREGPTDASQ